MKRICIVVVVLALALLGDKFYIDNTSHPDSSDNLAQLIIDSCLYERSVDISQFRASPEEVTSLVDSLRADGLLPWYTDTSSSYRYDPSVGFVVEFVPETLYDGAIDKKLYEQKVAEILDACVLDGMSQYQIALAIHDYLVVNSYYDETLIKRSGYDLLVNGSAVCSGYAAAYQDLLSRTGITSVCVTSEAMSHMWNLVKIDGQWYHVDVTWDDPTPDVNGQASHDYFLLTDNEISSGEEPHLGWASEFSCENTRFSNAYWRGVYSQICFVSKDTCYLLRSRDCVNSIYLRSMTSGSEDLVYAEKESFVDIGAGRYRYSHQGLSYWNGRLYFNTMDKIISMDPDGKDIEKVFTYNTKSNKKAIRGCYVSNGTTYISAADHNGNMSYFAEKIANVDYHTHNYIETACEPSCQEPGYTLSKCDCGLSFKSEFIENVSHNYHLLKSKDASVGYNIFGLSSTCSMCGESAKLVLTKPAIKEWVSDNYLVVILVWVGGFWLLLRKKD